MAEQYSDNDRTEAKQDDSNDTLDALHGRHTISVRGQSSDATEMSEEHNGSGQVAEQSAVSRVEAECTGGSGQGLVQCGNLINELEDAGTVVEEPGIEVQRDGNEEAVISGLVSTHMELAQDVLKEELPELCALVYLYTFPGAS